MYGSTTDILCRFRLLLFSTKRTTEKKDKRVDRNRKNENRRATINMSKHRHISKERKEHNKHNMALVPDTNTSANNMSGVLLVHARDKITRERTKKERGNACTWPTVMLHPYSSHFLFNIFSNGRIQTTVKYNASWCNYKKKFYKLEMILLLKY